MGKFSFRKEERLSREKHIQELFDKGSSFYLFPFKVFFRPHPDADHPVHQVLISVSARNFKKAVDRNLIKRRMREAYRMQKHALPESPKLLVGLVYAHKEILVFDEIRQKLQPVLQRISKSKLENDVQSQTN
jgi:ribonuclease P protein component